MNSFLSKNIDELKSELIKEKKSLMSLRFMHVSNQLKDVSLIRKSKKSIAKIFTAITSISNKENKNA